MKPAKSMDSKETLHEKAEARLEGLKARIDAIQAEIKAEHGNDAILAKLRQKHERAEEQLWVFKSASGESWRVFAADMDDAIDSLENTVKEAEEKLAQS